MKKIRKLLFLPLLFILPLCARVKVEPVEIKPIHVTMDINIRIQRELEDAFAFEDKFEDGAGEKGNTEQGGSGK